MCESHRALRAGCWDKFRIIYFKGESHNILVKNFVICKDCEFISHYNGSTTTKLKRHKCAPNENQPSIINFTDNFELNGSNSSRSAFSNVQFSESDKEMMKKTMSNFVVGNLNSIASVECKGYRDSIKAGVSSGRKYPQITEADVDRLLYSRTTIKNFIDSKASNIENQIKSDFEFVLQETGSFCVAVDLWKDEHRANI